MNTIPSFRALGLFLLTALLAFSCKDKTLQTFNANVPVYQSRTEWRATTYAIQSPLDLKNPGKMFIRGQYLFVNEYLKGVHIIDNTQPASPINLGFLPVHANVDIAVHGDNLYLDSYNDLLVFDITDPSHPVYKSRVEDVFDFSDFGYFESYNPNFPMAMLDAEAGIIIGWKVEKVTQEIGINWHRSGVLEDFTTTGGSAGTSDLGSLGKAGSTARFTTVGDYLYTLEPYELGVFDLNGAPDHLRDISLNRFSETLFPAGDHLFIGTQTGLIIYNVSNPASPVFTSDYNHLSACDPVIVEGNRAYVTLSTGRTCWGQVNALQVLDISNITNPSLLYEFPMTNPKGLGIDQNLLFICDGGDGLKVYDKTDPSTLDQHLLGQFSGITTNDVIPYFGVLIMTSEEGIYQYDYSNPASITQLSLIPVVH